jgi:hypothetical protein
MISITIWARNACPLESHTPPYMDTQVIDVAEVSRAAQPPISSADPAQRVQKRNRRRE